MASAFAEFQKSVRSARKSSRTRDGARIIRPRAARSHPCFEFTHELAWNTLKDFLESHGATSIYGSKDSTREAFSKGLIQEGETWMAMIKSRNDTSHTYNEETARQIAEAITSSYVREFEKFRQRFAELESSGP